MDVQRAIQRRQLFAAEVAARELGGLSLADALDLTLLMGEVETWRYERAAVRWLVERFIEERRPSLSEIALAGAALSEMGGAGDAVLRDLTRMGNLSRERRAGH
jgi:hypothetical protein